MKTICFCILTAVLCTSCSGGRTDAAHSGLVNIDVVANYPKEEIHLQDIAEIEYVPLAISDEALLEPSDKIFHLSDQFIMVQSFKLDEIYIFDRAGGIISRINHLGSGPGEYESIREILYDERAEEFFVVDWFSPEILVYSLTGAHKRTMILPEKWEIEEMYNFDVGALLVYEGDGMNIGFSPTPYHLISKTDGSILETLNIEMPIRYSSMCYWLESVNGQMMEGSFGMRFTNNRQNGDDFMLADKSSDTVYHFTRERVMTPAFVRAPSVHASEPRIVWGITLIANDFIVFEVQTLDFEKARTGSYLPIRSLKYDYVTGNINEVKFLNDDNTSAPWNNYGRYKSKNTAVKMLDPLTLKDMQAKGKLSGPLAKIANEITENDNPVVMIVKFK